MPAIAKKLLFSSAMAATVILAALPETPAENSPAPIRFRSNAKLTPAYVAALRAPKAYPAGSNGQWKAF
jgi:hypothetical protein